MRNVTKIALMVALVFLAVACGSKTDQLFKASQDGDVGKVKKLIADGAPVNATDQHGSTPLHYAAGKGHVQVVKLLLDNQASVNTRENDGFMPIHAAVGSGSLETVKLLVASGAQTDVLYRGILPAQSAINAGYQDIASLLQPEEKPEDQAKEQENTNAGNLPQDGAAPDEQPSDTAPEETTNPDDTAADADAADDQPSTEPPAETPTETPSE